ncbi:hypothetical protein DBR11_21285 [Pedobacter sp. HMWF019]|nr:hypothetical protein DBR11_21285 [Pedobacter sp. HMWF019]
MFKLLRSEFGDELCRKILYSFFSPPDIVSLEAAVQNFLINSPHLKPLYGKQITEKYNNRRE